MKYLYQLITRDGLKSEYFECERPPYEIKTVKHSRIDACWEPTVLQEDNFDYGEYKCEKIIPAQVYVLKEK